MRNRIVVNIYPTMPGTKWVPRGRRKVCKMLKRTRVLEKVLNGILDRHTYKDKFENKLM